MPGPQAVILDFDGVILDSSAVKTECFREFFAQFPAVAAQATEFHLTHKGTSRYEQFHHLCALLGEEGDAARIQDLDRRFSALVVSRVIECSFVPGAHEFLHRWSRRLPLHVASNTPHEELSRIIATRGLGPYLLSARGSTSGGGKAGVLAGIVAAHGYDPARVLFVGDTAPDERAAAEAGLPFIGLRNALSMFASQTIVLDDMNAVAAYLDSVDGDR